MGMKTARPRADFIYGTAGAFLTVRVRGEIDHHTASDIRTGIDALLLERRPERAYLDLSAVSFMDSSGLGLIMGRYAVMKELGGELVVLDPTPEARTILTLAGMERLLRIEDSRTDGAGEATAGTVKPASAAPARTDKPAGTVKAAGAAPAATVKAASAAPAGADRPAATVKPASAAPAKGTDRPRSRSARRTVTPKAKKPSA